MLDNIIIRFSILNNFLVQYYPSSLGKQETSQAYNQILTKANSPNKSDTNISNISVSALTGSRPKKQCNHQLDKKCHKPYYLTAKKCVSSLQYSLKIIDNFTHLAANISNHRGTAQCARRSSYNVQLERLIQFMPIKVNFNLVSDLIRVTV